MVTLLGMVVSHPTRFLRLFFAQHPRAKPVRNASPGGANERARGAQPFSRAVERRPVAVSGRANLFSVVVVAVAVFVVVVARARIVECSCGHTLAEI